MCNEKRSIVYVADPMCSWCWGFAPVIYKIYQRYHRQVNIQLLVGGLRPGNTERFDNHKREFILGHWHAVHHRTGQPFNFTFQMGSDFVYDTEPPSRAVLAVRQIDPLKEIVYFKAVQQAFYVNNKDVTKEAVLVGLVDEHGMNQAQFLELFRDPDLKKQVWNEFDHSRQLGVTGFPSLLGKNQNRLHFCLTDIRRVTT